MAQPGSEESMRPIGIMTPEEQPAIDQPTSDQPTSDQAAGNTAADQTTDDQTTSDQAASEQPSGGQTAGDSPAADQPSNDTTAPADPAPAETEQSDGADATDADAQVAADPGAEDAAKQDGDDAQADTDGSDEQGSSNSEAPEEEVAVDPYSLEEGAGTNLLTYQNLMDTVWWEPLVEYQIPVGCNVCADCETRAATIEATPGSASLTVIGCLDYGSGQYTVVLETPVSGSGFSPSEAHITDTLMCWVETNNATDDWVLYATTFLGMPISPNDAAIVKLDEGDADWLPPQVAVWGSTVVWQRMPDPLGPYVRDSSHAFRWSLGSSEATDIWTSPGRFGCPPDINQGVLTIAPRVRADEGVYYGITAIDLSDGKQIDQTVLPVSVKPFRATRIGNDFAFSIEANYGYGGLLGKMGYYFGSSDGPWDYVAREPSAQVSYVNGRYIVRSQLAYFVIDQRGWFSQISAADRCVDYGDYPASSGTTATFVTYTKVKNESTGIPEYVAVRRFAIQ